MTDNLGHDSRNNWNGYISYTGYKHSFGSSYFLTNVAAIQLLPIPKYAIPQLVDRGQDTPESEVMQRQEVLNRLSKRIKQLRKKDKISQENLAAEAGLSRIGMGQIEQAKKAPNLMTLYKIAHQGFGITISELMKGVDKE